MLGEVIVSALQRKRAFNDLRTSQERLDRAAAVRLTATDGRSPEVIQALRSVIRSLSVDERI